MKTLNFSRKDECDHRTVERFVADSGHAWVHADKRTMRKVSVGQTHQIKRETAQCLYKTANADLSCRCLWSLADIKVCIEPLEDPKAKHGQAVHIQTEALKAQ